MNKTIKNAIACFMCLGICLTATPSFALAATKPAPPKGLKSAVVSTTSVKLSWTKISKAKSYIIYQKSGSKYVKIASPKTNAYTVKKLKTGMKYSFKVAVKTASGTSKQSAAVNGYTKCAAPTGTKVTALSKTSVEVAWSAIKGAQKYRVYASTKSSGSFWYAGETKNKQFIVSGLGSGTNYYFKVAAINGNAQSGFSAVASAKTQGTVGESPPAPTPTPTPTPTKLPAPTGLRLKDKTYADLNFTWDAVPNTVTYKLYVAKNASGPWESFSWNNNEVWMNGLDPDTTYYFKVAAIDSKGVEGTQSGFITGRTNSLPAAPAAQAFSIWDYTESGSNMTVRFRRNNYQVQVAKFKFYYRTGGNNSAAWTYASEQTCPANSLTDVFFSVTVPKGAILSAGFTSSNGVTESAKYEIEYFAVLPGTPPFAGQGNNNFKCVEPPSSQFMLVPYTCTVSWNSASNASGYDVWMNGIGTDLDIGHAKLVKEVGTATSYTINSADTTKAGLHAPDWYLSYRVFVCPYIMSGGKKYYSPFWTHGQAWGSGGTSYW